MTDLCQAVLPSTLSFVSDTIIIQIQLIATVPTRVDTEGDGVHLALGMQLSNVLFQFPLRNNRAFSDVNGTVIPASVVPGSIEVKFHPSIDRSFKRFFVVFEMVPLASRWEVHRTVSLTWDKSIKGVFFVCVFPLSRSLTS